MGQPVKTPRLFKAKRNESVGNEYTECKNKSYKKNILLSFILSFIIFFKN